MSNSCSFRGRKILSMLLHFQNPILKLLYININLRKGKEKPSRKIQTPCVNTGG